MAIDHVRAWVGGWGIKSPAKAVELAKRAGLDGAQIITNDLSKCRRAHEYGDKSEGGRYYKHSGILRLAEAFHAAGMDVGLMTWVMPHRIWIESAAEVLVPLCTDAGADSLEPDAEEPWTQADAPMGYREVKRKSKGDLVAEAYDEAAALFYSAFQGAPTIGVNAIGYTSTTRCDGLMEGAAYGVPQLYVTKTSGLTVESIPRITKRWRKHFLEADQEMVAGLAAYRQVDARHDIPAAARACAATGCTKAFVWQLKSMRDAEVLAGVQGIRG